MVNENPFQILGIPEDSDEKTIREAYFTLIKKHPPDRDPEGFTRVRRAYDLVKDPEFVMMRRLFGEEDGKSLEQLIPAIGLDRAHAGPQPWLALIEATRKE